MLCWDGQPTELGRQQFYEYQTLGLHKHDEYNPPEYLDKYFHVLKKGKWQFDLISSSYRNLYCSGEFWGWDCLLRDWEGKEWILRHLCQWYKGDLDLIFGKEDV